MTIVIAFCAATLCGEMRTDFTNTHACMLGAQRVLAAQGVEDVAWWQCKRGERA